MILPAVRDGLDFFLLPADKKTIPKKNGVFEHVY